MINSNIAQLHFLTQDGLSLSHCEQARMACEAGIRWVQFRSKLDDWLQLEKLAREVKGVCDEFAATFIVNDHVQLAKLLGADGVHLGRDDMPPHEAREILGREAIIGASMNSLADKKRALGPAVDYVGIGPYRFTESKRNLAPLLGAYGVRVLVREIRQERAHIPVIAIGGITAGDLEEILATGANGVAVSSAISGALDRERSARQFAQFFFGM